MVLLNLTVDLAAVFSMAANAYPQFMPQCAPAGAMCYSDVGPRFEVLSITMSPMLYIPSATAWAYVSVPD